MGLQTFLKSHISRQIVSRQIVQSGIVQNFLNENCPRNIKELNRLGTNLKNFFEF